jgi:iron(III) transport system substrate-binding protein
MIKQDPQQETQIPPSGRHLTRRWRAPAAACGLLTCGLLAGCGAAGAAAGTDTGAASQGGGQGQSITLYSGQHEQTTNGLVTAFEQQTGIKVSVRNDDEATLANLIAVQGSHTPADVFFTENSPPLEFLQEKGLLSKVTPGTLADTPAKYDSPAGDWVGVSARVSVIVYNPSLIAQNQLPASVMQLADPKYQGKLGIAPGETDFQPIVTSVTRTYGHAAALSWLEKVKSNGASHTFPDNETLVSEVNRGQVAFGIINEYYWYRLKAEIGASAMHSRITYFAPHDPGYVIDVSGAAVLKDSKHQAAAQKFLAFLVSKKGEEIIGQAGGDEQSYEYPIGSGVTISAPETPFDQLQPNPITIAQLGDGAAAIALLRQAGLL